MQVRAFLRIDMNISLEMMQQKADKTLEAMAAIKEQIARAKSKVHETGDYSDSDWFHSANRALRHKAADHQILLREMAKAKEAAKQAAHQISEERATRFERSFMRAAKQMLDDATYSDIISEAKRNTDH